MRIKRAVLVLAAIGLTGAIVAEAPQSGEGSIRTASGSRITYLAGRAQRDDVVARLAGGVTFHVAGTTVTADEATVDNRSGEIRLSGDVRIKTR